MTENEKILLTNLDLAEHKQYFNYANELKDDTLGIVDEVLGFVFRMDEIYGTENSKQRS